ncbi:MAG: hypothetical protein Q8M94_17920, partial [Ignavibacteria bacterium]|nr:hypothetical protein [Ignavibacteria bacterium]
KIKEKIKEKKGEPVACAQVITYCIDPSTGECAVYPDACSTPKPCRSCSIEISPDTGCKNLCGDGICQEIVCMAIGCPCPETLKTCPEDCK